jgi:hypothetical protein
MRFIYLTATLCIALAFPQDVRRQVISAHDRIDGPLGAEYHVSDLQVFENGEVIYAEEGTKSMGAQPRALNFQTTLPSDGMRRLAELLGRQDIQSLPTKISPKTRPIDFSWQKSVEITGLIKLKKCNIENFYPFLNLYGPVYPKAVIELECRLQDIETEVTKRSPPKDEDNWCKELLEEEHEPAQADCIEDKTQPTIAAGEGWSPAWIGAASSIVDAFLGGGKPGEKYSGVSDKPGKDTNFRGMTIFNNTLYITKGSGGNGINTVYQVGSTGTLPTGTAADLANVPITILPGFPNSTGGTSTAFPFGIWFANETTLYLCDEGDGTLVSPAVNGNVADAQTLATAGLQKWSLVNATWKIDYVLQDGLKIGVSYSVANYPAALNPATDGCRNIAGKHNHDGMVTIYAVTSTISTNGDQGADPNKLVKVTDLLSATTLPTADGDHDRDYRIGHFVTIHSAKAGEVYRGVALAPKDHDDADDRW